MTDAAAIAAAINPVNKTANVYYLNESSQVDLHDVGGPIDIKAKIPPGYIERPSSFASVLRTDGLVGIYGITRHATFTGETEEQKKTLNVSLVSPIFRPTPCLTKAGCIASASFKSNSWLYYLNVKRQIMEFKVDDPNPAKKLITDSPMLYDSTYLTAFCDRQGLRHIFFRLESGNVSSYNQDDKSSQFVLDNSDIYGNSPMAVCMVVTGTGSSAVGTAYFYYNSPAKVLRRIHSTSNGNWSSPKTFNNVTLGDATQISLIQHEGTTKNTIFYHDGKELVSYEDDVSEA